MSGILTAIGEQKVAASFGGQVVTPTLIRIGDGNGAPITPNRLMTDLVRRVGTAYPITASARDAINPNMWRIQTEIPPGEGPFTLREIAVFDAAGDMIAIAAHPTAEFQGPSGTQLLVITDIVFPVSGQANIAVSITANAQIPLHRNLRPYFLSVENNALSAPPSTPATGATYVVAAAPTGAWAGQAGALAQWSGSDWLFTAPPIGHLIHVIASGVYMRRTSTGWVPFVATETDAGLIKLATAVQVAAGVNATDAVTPATLAGLRIGIDRPRRLPFMTVNEVARNVPPAAPVENDTFVIGAAPSGAWATREHQVAQWNGAAWVYAVASFDTIVRAQDTDLYWQRTAGGWALASFGLTRGQALHLGQ